MNDLLSDNMPWAFWRLLGAEFSAEDWQAASQSALFCLGNLPAAQTAELSETIAAILGEGQFGPRHWQLSPAKRLYYAVRPALPSAVKPLLQRTAARGRKSGGLLSWPLDDRYVRFQFETLRQLLQRKGLDSLPYAHFWPSGLRFALVLTHDVESQQGQRFVHKLAAQEEKYGFRSSFNFVPEEYPTDRGLLESLRERGFEIGVHGLRHDGKLFSSRRVFLEQAQRINRYLRNWQAVGFRAPLTNRNPEWMQALDIEYDASFFDTDPFEPIPGGTMSIWPFFIGRFVELPYTLAQDHTLLRTLGETTARLWLEKVAFIRQHCGLAIVNTHPDYLLNPSYLAVYTGFLAEMKRQGGYWQALPRDVARWWRQRAATPIKESEGHWLAPDLPELSIGRVRLARDDDNATTLILEPTGEQTPALQVM